MMLPGGNVEIALGLFTAQRDANGPTGKCINSIAKGTILLEQKLVI
jgi:hypothetical protein